MVKLLLILFLLFPVSAWGATYHVATDGSGDYTTIAQVNAATFVAGDEILFKRGDTWSEQLNIVSGLTYSYYGTGAKPFIHNISGDCSVSKNISNVIIDGFTISADDTSTFGIYFYSDGTGEGANITIKNCDVYDNRYGIFFRRSSGDGIIATCFHNIIIQDNNIYSNTEYGIAVYLIDGISYIKNNKVYDNGDNSILSVNGIWLANCQDVIIENNEVYNNATGSDITCYDGVGIFLDSTSIQGCLRCIVRNNLCYNHDSKIEQDHWGNPQFPGSGNSAGICIMGSGSDNQIYNNICYGNCFGIALWTDGTTDNYIYNNTLTGNRIGIFSETVSGTNYIKNNIIADNDLESTATLSGTELISNPSFETNTTGWYKSDAAPTSSTFSRTTTAGEFDSGSAGAKIAVTTGGGALSFWYTNITIEDGKWYKVTFKAKATTSFILGSIFTIHENSSPYTSRLDVRPLASAYTITTSWQTFTGYFKTNADSSTCRIMWRFDNLGSGETVYIDTISLKETNYDVNGGVVIKTGTLISDYNDNYNNENNYINQGSGQDLHSIATDPLLTSDYGLTKTSPCKDAGITLSEVTEDYNGVHRPMGSGFDIGSFEYGNVIKNAVIYNSTLN